MDLIERYIYAVTRHLSERQRDDIARELRGLIEDMLAQRTAGAVPGEKDIEEVLKELGEPAALATKYSGKPRHLIGPEIFGTYLMVLKIVLVSVGFAMLVAAAVRYAVAPPQQIGDIFGSVIGSVCEAVIQGFAYVTLIFAIIEYSTSDKNKYKWKKGKWEPADLPEIPDKETVIRPSEPIVGMIFIAIFFVILNFNPGLFAAYFSKSGQPPVPVLDLTVVRSYLWLIDIGFAASIIKEFMKLVYGRYNVRYAATSILLGSISFITTVIVFANFHFWNWNFIPGIQQAFGFSLPAGYDAVQITVIFAKVMLGITIFAFVVETVTTLVKTFRHNAAEVRRFFSR